MQKTDKTQKNSMFRVIAKTSCNLCFLQSVRSTLPALFTPIKNAHEPAGLACCFVTVKFGGLLEIQTAFHAVWWQHRPTRFYRVDFSLADRANLKVFVQQMFLNGKTKNNTCAKYDIAQWLQCNVKTTSIIITYLFFLSLLNLYFDEIKSLKSSGEQKKN